MTLFMRIGITIVNVKYFIFLALIASFSLEGHRHKKKLAPEPIFQLEENDCQEQELLATRRILKLWKDQEYQLAALQIYDFFDRFPASAQRDDFQIMLGNIALVQKEYPKALAAFDAVRDLKKREEMRCKRWQALYHSQNFTTLYQELSLLLPYLQKKEQDEGHFFFAEAALREALMLYPNNSKNWNVNDALEDQSKELAREALFYFEELKGHKKFGKQALLGIAESHRLLGNHKEAAFLYLDIAKKEKENEELLFHAATMLSNFDENQATQTFREVAYMGKERCGEAAYQWMQLLAKAGAWASLFKEKALFLAKLPPHRLPLFHFYTGMVLYTEKKWEEAKSSLRRSIEQGLLYPYDKNALTALAVCGYELGDIDIIEKVYPILLERYVEDVGDVAFLRAATYGKIGEKEQELELLNAIIDVRYSPKVMQRALKEKTYLLIETKDWEEAYQTCIRYLDLFPSKEMLKLAIDLSLHRLDREKGYAELTSHIETAMNQKIFASEDVDYYQTLLAKGLIKQERFKEALAILETQKQETAEIESLLALCYLKEGFPPECIIKHGEKALLLNPDLPEKDRLHLYLFNAYLDSAKNIHDPDITEHAEEHLYSIIHTFPVSLENRLWLAHRFAKNEEKKERAIEIFETLLYTPTQILRFPREAFVLANLYSEKGELQKAGILLENLQDLQEESPFFEEVRLALAHHYSAKGEKEKAWDLYTLLENSPEKNVALAATLEKTRLDPHNMEFNLFILKELWMKKKIMSEPIHLEAAFDYIAYLETTLEKEELLEHLKEIKKHFTLEDDIWSKDYHTTRYQMPEKDRIYQAYMRLLDASINKLGAQIELLQGHVEEAEKRKKLARALFSSLTHRKYAISKYFVEKVQKEMYDPL